LDFRVPPGQFETDELKYRNSAQHISTVINLNSLCFLNEPELLQALRTRYQRNILTTYVGQVLLTFNPLKATSGDERDQETDAELRKFALDIRNSGHEAAEKWEKAHSCLEAHKGSIGERCAGVSTGNRFAYTVSSALMHYIGRSTSHDNPSMGQGGRSGLLALLQEQLDEGEVEGGSDKETSARYACPCAQMLTSSVYGLCVHVTGEGGTRWVTRSS
jgi:hypothetical protein